MSCRKSTERKRAASIARNIGRVMPTSPTGSEDSSIPISPGRTHPAARAVYRSLDNYYLKTFFEAVLDQSDAIMDDELSRLVVCRKFEDTADSQQYITELLMRLEHHIKSHARLFRRFMAWLENEQVNLHPKRRPTPPA